MEAGMGNFMRAGYKGVTETWNVLQHEVFIKTTFNAEKFFISIIFV